MAVIQRGMDAEAPSALRDALAQIVRRLRRAHGLRLASRGALVSAGLALPAVGLARLGLLPLWLPLELVIPALLLSGPGLGLLFAQRQRVDAMSAARLAEARLGLKERLSSALEFDRAGDGAFDPEAALLRRLQGQDAASHARALRPADVVPLRLPWEAKASLAALAVLLLALILPALPILVPPSVRAERAVVQKSGEELARTARLIEKRADAQRLPATKRAAQAMKKLGTQMAQGRTDKKQAMVQMARLSKQMADEQRRLAQAGATGGQDGKSLEQAGRQLAQSLSQTASGPRANTPGQAPSAGQAKPAAPEMQKAAQALKGGSAPGLGEQLRDMAQRISSQPPSPDGQRSAAQDLQKLSDALKGTPLSEARKHVQAAADAMKQGDPQRAAGEMRQAADAADRQAKPPQDAQGVQDAQDSLQASQQRMAQASTPADIRRDSSGPPPGGVRPTTANPQSQPGQNEPDQHRPGGAGESPGQRQGQGKPGAAGQNPGGIPQSGASQGGTPNSGGSGKSLPARPGPRQSARDGGRTAQPSPGDGGVVHGAPHPLGPNFNPAKNPKYGRIFLGAGDGSGGGGKSLPSRPGAPPTGRPRAGDVPYYSSLAPARKTAETAMDREDIPPAYRSSVRRYFDSLRPPAGQPPK